MARPQLDQLDNKILNLLKDNARKPFLEVARECNVSGAAVHQRVARLQSLGVIEGSALSINPSSIGYETCAFIGFFLSDPSKFQEVVEQLKEIPEVVECYFTTGRYDLFVKLYARNNDHLLWLIQNRLLALGVARTESLVSFKEVFSRKLPVGEETV